MRASFLIVQYVVLFQPVEGVSRVKARHQHLVDKNLAQHTVVTTKHVRRSSCSKNGIPVNCQNATNDEKLSVLL